MRKISLMLEPLVKSSEVAEESLTRVIMFHLQVTVEFKTLFSCDVKKTSLSTNVLLHAVHHFKGEILLVFFGLAHPLV